jgi:hypothetical protein
MIGPDTNVFPWVFHPPYSGQRAWISSYETVRNNLGELVIQPKLDSDPSTARSMPYQAALILKRRIESENVISPLYTVHFSLDPTSDEVGAGHTTSAPTEDQRVVMTYKGILVRPGVDVNRGRCWFVRFPNTTIESIKADSVEAAVDTVFDRGLQDKAEQAPPPPAPPPPESASQNNYGARVRPGDLR